MIGELKTVLSISPQFEVGEPESDWSPIFAEPQSVKRRHTKFFLWLELEAAKLFKIQWPGKGDTPRGLGATPNLESPGLRTMQSTC